MMVPFDGAGGQSQNMSGQMRGQGPNQMMQGQQQNMQYRQFNQNHFQRPPSNNFGYPMQNMQMQPQHMGMASNAQYPNMGPGNNDARRQQPQQGNYASGMNGNWQSERDMQHRRGMIQQIVKMLKKDKNSSPEWLDKLPQMARQLEVSLYRNARSLDDYMDLGTLKQRLQLIAYEVSRKAKSQGGSSSDPSRSSSSQRQRAFNGMHNPDGMMNQSGSQSPYNRNNPMSQQMMQQPPQQMPSRQVVKMDQINPIAGTSQNDMMRQSGSSSGGGSGSGGDNYGMGGSSSRSQSQNAMNSSSGGSNQGNQGRNDPEFRIRIRHKQQRLLLLHHSAKCPAEAGTCQVTPHCADMKRLWRHMEGCKDNNCRVPHCFSSRAILSHYRKCRDASCPACGPVRDTIRRAQNKSSRRSDSSRQNSSQSQQSQSMQPVMNNFGMSSSMGSQPGMGMASPDPIAPGMSFNSQNQFQQRQTSSSSMPPPMPGANPNMGVMNGVMNQFNTMSSSGNNFGHQNNNSSMQMPSAQGSSSQSMYRQDQMSNSDMMSVQNHGNNHMSSSASINNRSTSSSSNNQQSGRGGRDSSEWQKVRHKQQRLLLLRHASKCQYEAGTCPTTPHCASMKKLWQHIAHCKDQKCSVQHCMSSRYVLSHYRRCRDTKCPACGPVRETIRKSHEKERGSSHTGQNGSNAQQSSSNSNSALAGMVCAPISSQSASMDVPNSATSDSQPERKRPKTDHSGPRPPATPSSDKSTKERASSGKSSASRGKGGKTNKGSDHSLINSFTVKEIETHLASLHRAVQLPLAKLKAKCSEVLKGLQSHTHGWVFNAPVDPVELGLPDYFQIIKKPMDLGTISKKLESGAYHSIDEFSSDVRLTFDNATTYNEAGSVVHDMAKELKAKFEADHKKLMMQLEQEDRDARKNERACTLCGCEKLLFEPPVFFCNGVNCASQRIRRNSHFYIGGNNQYFWCNQCYNELNGSIPIELVDMTIMKSDLKKKKNDDVHEESWVQCDQCESWIHQICGLFNARQNKEHHSKYFCPKCLLQKRKSGVLEASPRPLSAADLPRTTLSEFLEKHIHKKVMDRKSKLVKEKVETEKISFEQAMKQLEYGGPITIRQVTATDRKLEVRELMKKRYAHKNYPDEFPFRCKCLVVFQKIDGVDVVLFALYVYEHGADNPAPNQRAVYISYLDSVHFMRPRKLRTFVYHELLICYLDYARRKGFATAHIWACPPLKGDDYIFYAKPEDQKTPRDARLRQWYLDMLAECQRRDICGKVTNMYDLYFANEKLDATAVPYLEGDYFPGEAENIIKDIMEGGGKKGSGGKKKGNKSKKSKGRGGTRSDDEIDLTNGADGNQKKSFMEGGRDEVMVKMGETIHPMKESFIVAFLNWSGAKPEDMVVPKEIQEHRQKAKANGTFEEVDLSETRKRGLDGELKDKQGKPIKVIDDDDEDMDCEFLNNRQAFLNLCRGNHYQFDELRRAKHTSMMVIWHLHNREAPKFVQQCAVCNREILTGTRYHCNSCPDYDLCEDCYRNPNTNRGTCTHRLQPIQVENDSNQEGSDGGTNGLTDAQRRERQRNLQLHIQLIEHASRCNSQSCNSSNCAKMKNYLAHGKTCKQKASGGCKICKRIWTLLRIHAQKCKDSVCPIPQCMAIRERIRQLAKQQQAMDDRRRQEMNRAYRMSMTSGSG